jgi:hypothetical protein
MNTYNSIILEAITEMAEGRPEYNNGVLSCIGRLDIWLEWNFANAQTCEEVNALNRMLEEKHGEDEIAKMLDTTKDTSALDAALTRRALAWAAIQSIIDAARNDLGR